MTNQELSEAPDPTTIADIEARFSGCKRCPGMWGGPVFYEGSPASSILWMAEALGEQEVKQRRPLIGPAGQVFNSLLEAAGLIRGDQFLVNTVSCRPPSNKIEPWMIRNCKPFRETIITEWAKGANSKVIVALGSTAMNALFPDIKSGILDNRGKVMYYKGTPVVLTLHPSFVMRKDAEAKAGGTGARVAALCRRNAVADFLLAKSIKDKEATNGQLKGS